MSQCQATIHHWSLVPVLTHWCVHYSSESVQEMHHYFAFLLSVTEHFNHWHLSSFHCRQIILDDQKSHTGQTSPSDQFSKYIFHDTHLFVTRHSIRLSYQIWNSKFLLFWLAILSADRRKLHCDPLTIRLRYTIVTQDAGQKMSTKVGLMGKLWS